MFCVDGHSRKITDLEKCLSVNVVLLGSIGRWRVDFRVLQFAIACLSVILSRSHCSYYIGASLIPVSSLVACCVFTE